MRLYQLDENKILEYQILRSHEKEREYKSEVIGRRDNAFYNIITSSKDLATKIRKGETIDHLYYSKINNFDMRVIPSHDDTLGESREETLEKFLTLKDYVNNSRRNQTCLKIENLRPPCYQREYFLLSGREEQTEEEYRFDAWKMPVEAAGITLLEQREYQRFLEDKDLLEALPSELYQAFQIGEYDANFLRIEIPEMKKINQAIEVQSKILSKIKK